MDGAAIILDRPSGGWGDLATRRDLDALEARLERRLVALESNVDKINDKIDNAFRDQLRWVVGSMIGLSAVIVAALKF